MEKTFEENVKKYNPLIYSFINKTFVQSYEKEDLYQEALIVLHEAMGEFDKDKGVKFSTYLYIKLRNKMYDLIKGSRELTLVDTQSALIEGLVSPDEVFDDDNDAYIDKVEKDLLDALLKMPRGDITYLIIYGGLTQNKVAEIKGISQQRVQYLHKRNLKKLKELFNYTIV